MSNREPDYADVMEMSDTEFEDKITEIAKTRDFSRYGTDGNLVVWEKTYSHRKIKYDIILLRYYILNTPINQISGINRHSRWFVLEYPHETEEIAEIYNDIDDGYSEFLYKDTIHSWDMDNTLEQLFNKMVKAARSDINEFLDDFESTLGRYDQIENIDELRSRYREFLYKIEKPKMQGRLLEL